MEFSFIHFAAALPAFYLICRRLLYSGGNLVFSLLLLAEKDDKARMRAGAGAGEALLEDRG